MIKSAQNKPVSELLSIDANWRFLVPRYQREYVWGRDDWGYLFDDLWENPPGYFLGSMICINRSDDTMQVQELEVVDGQQRLATLSLLYAAVRASLATCTGDEQEQEEIRNDLFVLQHRLVCKGRTRLLRLEPSYQGSNYDDYRAILWEAGILTGDVPIPRNAGNRRLFRAYRFFVDRLDELDKLGRKVFDAEQLRRVLERLNRACLVKIEVASHADAFTLFESLNNRGEPLSALDLIKNNLLAALERRAPHSIDENFDRWTRMLDHLSDNYTAQERFLRHYYNAFKYREEVAVPKATLATRSNIINIYDTLIGRDAEGVFSDLIEKAKLYGKLITPESDAVPADLTEALLDLSRIGGTPSYVLLLFLLSERPNMSLASLCEFLVRYFVRRNLTDVPPTRDLARMFIDVTEKVRQGPVDQAEEIVRQELLAEDRVATEGAFKEKLSGAIYSENVDVTRFILCRIETAEQTREKLTDLWERDERGRFIWTVEHIFPQGKNIPASWVDMIASGDEERAREYRESHAHRLGNLTLTGYNSKLGTKSFEEKRDRQDARGRCVGYKNGLSLNEDLREATRWTVRDIEVRTEALVDKALKLLSLRRRATTEGGE